MAVQLLATKLYSPPPPPKIVARPRLIERLNEGIRVSAGRKLTLISAPAGFGKSTLVSEWLAGCGLPAAWLSLDEGDSNPTRFLSYLVAALRTIAPDLGEDVLRALQSPAPPPTESILTALLNEITAISEPFLVVLDDYHVVDSRAVDEALTFLVEHLPPRLHLVITTREDPALPIPRLRARRQLTELRAADLRFTPSEAAEFLNQVMDLHLSAEDVAALEDRTEGWVAGLQLAALSMRGHNDVLGFIRAFAGDHRYIVDYLVEEVLQRQPEETRSFLLQTSILDRLSAPLCDAVVSQPGSKAKLEQLQRENLFLIPLDDQRHWYRYHHLFADVLRMHMMAEMPHEVSALHRRASAWYEQNGAAADTIHHALAGEDFDRAADLVERAIPAMGQSRQESILLGWLQALPDELLRYRPVLSVHYAGALMQSGKLDGVEERLRDSERWLDVPLDATERPVFVDERDFHRLPSLVAMHRAGIALVRGEVADTMQHARRTLALAREDDYFVRGAASALLGLASWTNGDLETAHQTYAEGMAHLQRVGFISDAIGGSLALADIRITQGRLHEAMKVYERGLQLATEKGVPGLALRGTADMHVGMSELHREHNDLQTAMQHLQRSQELGAFAGFPQNPYRWRVAMARIRVDQGDLDGALDLLHEAERLYVSDFYPNVRPVAAWKARVWIAQGRLDEALAWAREQGISAEDELSYLREFEHITLARVLAARSTPDTSRETIGLLERLLQAAQAGGRIGRVIEILALQALAHRGQGDTAAALTSLECALKLAEPEGFMRTFLAEGTSMAQLIREAAAQGTLPEYTSKLLSAFDAEQKGMEREASRATPSAPSSLIDPLSQRELDVLRLLRTELSGPEIARELVIGLSTVRTHTKSIYSKLNVNSRRAAVRQAEKLGLI